MAAALMARVDWNKIRATAPQTTCPECGAQPGEPCSVVSYGFQGRGTAQILNRIRKPHPNRPLENTTQLAPVPACRHCGRAIERDVVGDKWIALVDYSDFCDASGGGNHEPTTKEPDASR